MTSPAVILSPFFFFHTTRVPSVIVSLSLGIWISGMVVNATEHRLAVCAPSGAGLRCKRNNGQNAHWAHRPDTYVPVSLASHSSSGVTNFLHGRDQLLRGG